MADGGQQQYARAVAGQVWHLLLDAPAADGSVPGSGCQVELFERVDGANWRVIHPDRSSSIQNLRSTRMEHMPRGNVNYVNYLPLSDQERQNLIQMFHQAGAGGGAYPVIGNPGDGGGGVGLIVAPPPAAPPQQAQYPTAPPNQFARQGAHRLRPPNRYNRRQRAWRTFRERPSEGVAFLGAATFGCVKIYKVLQVSMVLQQAYSEVNIYWGKVRTAVQGWEKILNEVGWDGMIFGLLIAFLLFRLLFKSSPQEQPPDGGPDGGGPGGGWNGPGAAGSWLNGQPQQDDGLSDLRQRMNNYKRVAQEDRHGGQGGVFDKEDEKEQKSILKRMSNTLMRIRRKSVTPMGVFVKCMENM